MANPEHLAILRQGVEAWNLWRKQNPEELADLSYAELLGANLSGANLCNAYLRQANLIGADLKEANLSGTNFTNARLNAAIFYGANLIEANLTFADLRNGNLCFADFRSANLKYAGLSGTSLLGADLSEAILQNALLRGANLSEAKVGRTNFSFVDLSEVKGLDTLTHCAPSTIGIDTLYISRGKIPDKFLRDAGVPEKIIDIARSIRNGPPIQWHSCFISYSTKDDEFARRLLSRMREANMRVWFAPENLKGGRKLHEQLFEAIQIHDRLLIVLSEHSIQSEWVMTEIRKAREVERKEKRRKLFPIRLTDFETLRDWTCFDSDTGKDLAVEVREYFIPDFSNWKDHDAFEVAFARLKKDLEAENSRRS